MGLTQQELANKLGYTSKQAITKIESGDNNIPLSKVEAFAEALETTPQELLQFSLPNESPAIAVSDITSDIIKRVKNLTTEELLELRGYISGKFNK